MFAICFSREANPPSQPIRRNLFTNQKATSRSIDTEVYLKKRIQVLQPFLLNYPSPQISVLIYVIHSSFHLQKHLFPTTPSYMYLLHPYNIKKQSLFYNTFTHLTQLYTTIQYATTIYLTYNTYINIEKSYTKLHTYCHLDV